jgi:hypothetical protein
VTVDGEHEPADGIRRVGAVLAHLGPRLVAKLPLIDAIRLDESREGLGGERLLLDGRVQAPHHLRARRPLELALELVQQ